MSETNMLEIEQNNSIARIGLIPRDHLRKKLDLLRSRSMIINDKGEDIPFEGEAKEHFIRACEEGFPIIEKALSHLYELGQYLHEVRSTLKPKKLYYAWLDFTGIPTTTAQNYVQAYVRYRERLPLFAHLGIRKLLIASRLNDCAEYVAQHEREIAEIPAKEFERKIKDLRRRKYSGNRARGPKSTRQEIGPCSVFPSIDGTRLRIEGITPDIQSRLIEMLKSML